MHNLARSIHNDKPIGVQYWTSSLTSLVDINPSFRVFYVDEQTMLPVKIETHYLDVEERPMP